MFNGNRTPSPSSPSAGFGTGLFTLRKKILWDISRRRGSNTHLVTSVGAHLTLLFPLGQRQWHRSLGGIKILVPRAQRETGVGVVNLTGRQNLWNAKVLLRLSPRVGSGVSTCLASHIIPCPQLKKGSPQANEYISVAMSVCLSVVGVHVCPAVFRAACPTHLTLNGCRCRSTCLLNSV